MQHCRLLRLDDLQSTKKGGVVRVSECVQREPQRVTLPKSGDVIDIAIDNQGKAVAFVHLL